MNLKIYVCKVRFCLAKLQEFSGVTSGFIDRLLRWEDTLQWKGEGAMDSLIFNIAQNSFLRYVQNFRFHQT